MKISRNLKTTAKVRVDRLERDKIVVLSLIKNEAKCLRCCRYKSGKSKLVQETKTVKITEFLKPNTGKTMNESVKCIKYVLYS